MVMGDVVVNSVLGFGGRIMVEVRGLVRSFERLGLIERLARYLLWCVHDCNYK